MQPYVREIGIKRHRTFEMLENLLRPPDIVQDEAEFMVTPREVWVDRNHFLGRAHGVVIAASPKTGDAERPSA